MWREAVQRVRATVRRPSPRSVAGWVVGAVVLIWLVQAVDWSATLRTLARLQLGWLILVALAIGLHTLARAQRWRVLFYPTRLPFEPVLAAMLVGQTLNYWLPVRLGDVPRVAWLSARTGVRKSYALGTLLVEKLWDILPLIGVLYLASWAGNVPQSIVGPLQGVAVLGTLGVAALFAVVWARPLIDGLLRHFAHGRVGPLRLRVIHTLQGLLDGFHTLRSPAALARAAGATVLAWFFGAAANWLAFQSLQLPLGWDAALLMSAALRVGVSLSTLPAAIGIYESAVVLSLSVFSTPFDVAMSYALVMHAIDLSVPLGMTVLLVARSTGQPIVERGV